MLKIKIDKNEDIQNINFILNENSFYDNKTIGKFCEEKNQPLFAFISYSKEMGKYDNDVIEVSNKNMLYRELTEYLIKRKSTDLW